MFILVAPCLVLCYLTYLSIDPTSIESRQEATDVIHRPEAYVVWSTVSARAQPAVAGLGSQLAPPREHLGITVLTRHVLVACHILVTCHIFIIWHIFFLAVLSQVVLITIGRARSLRHTGSESVTLRQVVHLKSRSRIFRAHSLWRGFWSLLVFIFSFKSVQWAGVHGCVGVRKTPKRFQRIRHLHGDGVWKSWLIHLDGWWKTRRTNIWHHARSVLIQHLVAGQQSRVWVKSCRGDGILLESECIQRVERTNMGWAGNNKFKYLLKFHYVTRYKLQFKI